MTILGWSEMFLESPERSEDSLGRCGCTLALYLRTQLMKVAYVLTRILTQLRLPQKLWRAVLVQNYQTRNSIRSVERANHNTPLEDTCRTKIRSGTDPNAACMNCPSRRSHEQAYNYRPIAVAARHAATFS